MVPGERPQQHLLQLPVFTLSTSGQSISETSTVWTDPSRLLSLYSSITRLSHHLIHQSEKVKDNTEPHCFFNVIEVSDHQTLLSVLGATVLHMLTILPDILIRPLKAVTSTAIVQWDSSLLSDNVDLYSGLIKVSAMLKRTYITL